MADGTPNLSGASPTAGTGPITDVLAGSDARKADLTGALSQYSKATAQNSETETKQLGALEAEAGKLTPPKLDIPPPPTPRTSDPHQVWGSMAMGLAALGSLFTRTPLTTAMNAAADVVTAYRQKDQAAADQAFQTWKTASDNYVQMANFQQKAYDEALSGIERRERLTIEEKSNADRQAEAQLRGVMTAFQDTTGLERLQVSGLQGVQHLIDQRREWNEKFELQLPKLAEQNAFMKAVTAMEQDPRFQQLQQTDPVKAYQAIEAIKQSVAPSMTLKPAQKISAENRISADLTKTPVYKDWSFANEAQGKIDSVVTELKDGSISNAVAADQFTQIFNGGRAIRGFQMQMLSGHQSLGDMINVAIKHLKSGGGLSDDQIAQMSQAAKLTTAFETQQMHAAALAAQAKAIQQGVDPHAVLPLDYAAYVNDHPEQTPPGVSVPPTGAALPKDLPPPTGHKEGSKLKDSSGKVIAVLKGGQWVAPDGGQ